MFNCLNCDKPKTPKMKGKKFPRLEHPFEVKLRKFCNPSCQHQSMKKRILKKCDYCGKELSVEPSRPRHKSFYCSRSCYRKGKSLKPSQWSQKFEKCVHCNQIDTRHVKKGLCKRCYNRDRTLRHDFGITIFQRDEMIKNQNNVCALCSCPQSSKIGPLGVDHDHKTGMIREMLCNKCNAALGLVNDNITLLQNMILYIQKHRNLPLVNFHE